MTELKGYAVIYQEDYRYIYEYPIAAIPVTRANKTKVDLLPSAICRFKKDAIKIAKAAAPLITYQRLKIVPVTISFEE